MKKGDWSLTTIAAFILIIVVLIILVIAFRGQFAALMKSFSELLKGVSGGEEIVKEAVKPSVT